MQLGLSCHQSLALRLHSAMITSRQGKSAVFFCFTVTRAYGITWCLSLMLGKARCRRQSFFSSILSLHFQLKKDFKTQSCFKKPSMQPHSNVKTLVLHIQYVYRSCGVLSQMLKKIKKLYKNQNKVKANGCVELETIRQSQ